MTDLTRTIINLLEPLKDLHARLSAAAPNNWELYMDKLDKDRGTELEYDYEIYDHGETTVIYPVANAAKEFLASILPANCTRWGAAGYSLETEYVHLVLKAMQDVRLISEDEYANLMEIEQQNQDMASQADQDFAEYQEGDR